MSKNKCDNCPAFGNFNGCPCYFGNRKESCNIDKRKVNKMIAEAEERNEAYYDMYVNGI